MERKIKVFRFLNPEKIVVFRAESRVDQIRFYLSERWYVVAVENENGCHVGIEQRKEEAPKSSTSFLHEYAKILLGGIAVAILLSWYLYIIIKSGLLYLLCINTILFIVYVAVDFFLLPLKQVAPTLRSKHAAEHMMINFLTKNKRLPQSMEEIRKSSRFSANCGSKKKGERTANQFIATTIAIASSVMLSKIAFYFTKNSIIESMVLLFSFLLMIFIAKELVKTQKWLQMIKMPIQKALTYLMQCATTTKNVEDRDICLAYVVAKKWMQIVYPDFYHEEEDIFCEKYFYKC